MRAQGFTLVELLVTIVIVSVLAVLTAGAGWNVYRNSSLAVSAANIRQLSMGGQSYLADNNHVFWPYRRTVLTPGATGAAWWFGFETTASLGGAEGTRDFDPQGGPLGAYVPKGTRPDPSFAFGGTALKPKYRNGYIGVGYNVLLGGGWSWNERPEALRNYWALSDPSKVVVFFTSAQVNTMQAPASPSRPMLEEFYGIDEREVTVHFRHRGYAMVAFADGNAGFLPIDESTRDSRASKANIGRFAPKNSKKYLE